MAHALVLNHVQKMEHSVIYCESFMIMHEKDTNLLVPKYLLFCNAQSGHIIYV